MNPITGSQTAVIVREDGASVADLLRLAVDKLGGEGAPAVVEALEKLVALHERVEAKRAAGEFASAMAAFQQTCPSIPRSSTAKIVTKSGSSYSYRYAELDQIAEIVKPFLGEAGMFYSWDTEDQGDKVKCTCILRHSNGHMVSSTFSCPTDSKADMSGAQRNGSAVTYAKRQSLIQVLGLTTCDPDTDGADHAKITKHQAMTIETLIADSGADEAKFLQFMGVAQIGDIPISGMQRAVNALDAKRRRGNA